MYAGSLRTARNCGSSVRTMENFDARVISSRCAVTNGFRNSSLAPRPYTSAVSKSVTPAARAASSVSRAAASSVPP